MMLNRPANVCLRKICCPCCPSVQRQLPIVTLAMEPILGRRAFCRCVIDSILFVLRSFSSSYCFFCDEILSCCLDDHEWSSTICRKRNLSRSPNHSANALCATQISSSGYWHCRWNLYNWVSLLPSSFYCNDSQSSEVFIDAVVITAAATARTG